MLSLIAIVQRSNPFLSLGACLQLPTPYNCRNTVAIFVLPRKPASCMYRAVIFDRDGVLTDFDFCRAATFFRPLLPLSLDELAAFWREWGQTAGFPSDLAAEKRFWRAFWDHLSEALALSEEMRCRSIRAPVSFSMTNVPASRAPRRWVCTLTWWIEAARTTS
jgi:hypothetical protein